MRKELMELIPEFNLIQDKDLLEKTLKVWEYALRENNWKIEDLLEMPFTLLIDDPPANIINHTRAVTLTCLRIADAMIDVYKEKIHINQDYLIAGALLHDVGKLYEFKKEGEKFIKSKMGKIIRHPVSGAALAYKFGIPEEIVHIIAAHSKEGEIVKRTVEAIIVHHADFVNFEPFK
ncbi:HDIG domain-containing protein [Candidatus Aminicenantes bacterium AC-335-A11]|jgi:putative nucleotidyltransferase with HDIG domain|nr:HDIG domain-containing protein [SCandidatus Aminicenantes bacterium Aminicenantia_JdfR_composite]MCP2598354.1 HDIG domain-containing protein [Candidatus Aminicenantes bacterium AC-335-L06]MCP2618586.1 HDIG domain-containing protein [Candidatus Aminicenantes bacterium AC-335-A11]MCP2620776.1 HDIG domain-containing protein [Candidatus Aminicenantes bacterium AC-334-E05]